MASYAPSKDTASAQKAPESKQDQPAKRAPKASAKDAPVFTDWAAI
ncbi:MAG: hypothetical protein ACRBCL_09755 [Maritimibacter sp.]